MSSYFDTVTQHARLAMLCFLAEQPGYEANDSVIRDGLVAAAVIRWSRDRVRTEINWLAEQGLVTVGNVGPFMVAEITTRGAEVAAGTVATPGVKRPDPAI